MITCKKRYNDLPFAHRQHTHAGHCSLIHGHNWAFEFTFGSNGLDLNGFVVDFGGLQWLKTWLHQQFDHRLVLNLTDPFLDYLRESLEQELGKWPKFAAVTLVPNCGAEGLAMWVFTEIDRLLRARTENRVFLVAVEVFEDEKNSAKYTSPEVCQHG